MPSTLVRLALFLSAYAPLLLLFAILDSLGSGWPAVACAVTAALSVVLLGWTWVEIRRQNPTVLQTAETRPRDADVLSFFVSYVVPFAAAQDGSGRDRIALLVFLVVIVGLFLRSGLLYANPLLALVGFRLFEVKDESGRFALLLTRRRFLRQKDVIKAIQVDEYLHVERP